MYKMAHFPLFSKPNIFLARSQEECSISSIHNSVQSLNEDKIPNKNCSDLQHTSLVKCQYLVWTELSNLCIIGANKDGWGLAFNKGDIWFIKYKTSSQLISDGNCLLFHLLFILCQTAYSLHPTEAKG
jgi:hypothetical protein